MLMTMRNYLDSLKELDPKAVLAIEGEVNPATFGVTAILRSLEMAGKYPLVYFGSTPDLQMVARDQLINLLPKLSSRHG